MSIVQRYRVDIRVCSGIITIVALMQGQRSSIGSATCDSTVDPQRYWNSMGHPSEEQLSDCVVLSSNPNIAYQDSAPHEEYGSRGWNSGESTLRGGAHSRVNLNDSYQNSAPHEGTHLSGRILGESSSNGAHNLVNQNDSVSEGTRSAHLLGERRYFSPEGPSLDNVNRNQHDEQGASGPLFMQSSTPQNLTNLEFTDIDDDDDDCQVIECVDTFRSGSSFQQCPGSSSSSHPFGTPSGSGGFIMEDTDERSRSSLDGRRSSCKRKTLEASAGQSSRSESSSYDQHIESSLWQGMTLHHNTTSSVPVPTENILTANLSDQSHPRLGSRVAGPASDVPLALSSTEAAQRSLRNFRLRINNSHQLGSVPGGISSTQDIHGNANVSSAQAQRRLRLPPISNLLDSSPFTVAENGSHQSPTSATRQNSQSCWYRAPSSGTASSSSAIPGERAFMHEEQNSGSIPSNISQHPMFIPTSEISNSYQTTGNWGLAAENVGVSARIASSSGVGLSSGVNSTAPSLVPLRSAPHYLRRPSEFGRRSLIPPPGVETGNQDSNDNSLHSGPASSWTDTALPSGSSNHGHHRLHSRSAALLLERHLGSTIGIPYSSRSSAASGEGRSRLVSEIRNVLDRMRRGEGLRAEDAMILDQSVFFGMADFHDRHRDMRLDVDNMSYEELLALEERIGNVCTGLSEETISSRLKQWKYNCMNTEGDAEAAEPCCICQEKYKDGEDLGTLQCGHDFHSECIKQWLKQKNSCPICKTTGLNK
ncbi:hypothetical protein Leryth_008735 [Lithospermum erythrorhizon]|nr:hypothetical protein Leryth_008735 [Lithospermum erythrorhizon]